MPLHGTRSGGLKAGEIVVTDDEIGIERDPYTEIARRFFNEFLELKLSLEERGAITPDQQIEYRRKAEKELDRWKRAVEELKLAAKNLAEDNKRLGEEVAQLQEQNENLRRQLNEAIMKAENMRVRHRLPKEEPGDYPLTQHMSERAFREWQRILTEIPYGGDRDDSA